MSEALSLYLQNWKCFDQRYNHQIEYVFCFVIIMLDPF